jgi:hypothetical protein
MEKIIHGIAIGRENVTIDDTHQPIMDHLPYKKT